MVLSRNIVHVVSAIYMDIHMHDVLWIWMTSSASDLLTMIYHKISDLILGTELLKSLIFPLIKTVKMTLIVLIC